MLRSIQLGLLWLFGILAALTALQQVRYGMLTGRSEQPARQDDPAAQQCRKQAVYCAVGAAVSLILCLLIGVWQRIVG